MITQQKNDINILSSQLEKFWALAKQKVQSIEREYDPSQGSPVFTVNGKYTTRGWTQWTQGFQYGIPLLVFEATGDKEMLEIGRKNTLQNMTHHLSHFGVHDHGFNNLSTYGNLLRLANQGLYKCNAEEIEMLKLALKMSGSVQAKRWTSVQDGGFIYSFNGPHSLFIDTIRTCRILVAAHILGHQFLDEGDKVIDLMERVVIHGLTTAKYAVYYGEGRDHYDKRGRVAHESIFNLNDGAYRCPNSQQGFSGFTTWTRGLSWAMLGFSELLEYFEEAHVNVQGYDQFKEIFLKAARATCDFYLAHTASDGIPYWDTGAPMLHKLGDYQARPSEPYNDFEPVDSSAAAIGAQGLLRLANYLKEREPEESRRYERAGFNVLQTLLSEQYLSLNKDHQGLLLHSVYHRPNGWDHIPDNSKVPAGESSMWGDYHLVELSFLAHCITNNKKYAFYHHLI